MKIFKRSKVRILDNILSSNIINHNDKITYTNTPKVFFSLTENHEFSFSPNSVMYKAKTSLIFEIN